MQVPSLVRKGFSLQASITMRSEHEKSLRLMLPVLVSTWVQPIYLTINTKFGSFIRRFCVTAINLSNNRI